MKRRANGRALPITRRCGLNTTDTHGMRDLAKEKLRQQVRKKRNQLSAAELAEAQRNLAENAAQFEPLQNARQVLSYIPAAGEISPETIVGQLQDSAIYLPRISDYQNHSMQFFSADNPRSVNRFRIEEPIAQGSPIDAHELDAVLLPLLLFGRNGTRVGMGGGYYDRAFAFRLAESTTTRPLLIGIAHHFQEAFSLTAESWDVPLDAIITDRELIQLF